ncbi:MAG: hypothetical protein KJ795_01230 [Gammaproteobacteria bacterium]|nr:hypothetical protein [Gammaproteobacteria bacterium]MBU1776210.1 hypothetical protein [Gammaproteobacteria bacterium]
MTDAELEQACEEGFAGASQWAHWTSELYSLGKCLRIWTGYPECFPLFVYSDHGVGLHSHLFPHEIENPARLHLTWNPVKELRNAGADHKRVIQIVHPWISYRRQRGITRTLSPRGTLVFYMHGTDVVQWQGHDSEEYFKQLRELPEELQPVVLCLHMHDIRAGVHKKLRRYGFPIVTAGNTMATDFVDRFYDLIKDFSCATAQTWGSYAAYCVELGVPFFFLGEQPKLMNIADSNLPAGIAPQYWDSYHEELEAEAELLFRVRVDTVTPKQRAFVESLLGFGSKLNRWQVSRLLWREFFRSWRQWHTLPRSVAVALLFRFGLLSKVRGMRNRYKTR